MKRALTRTAVLVLAVSCLAFTAFGAVPQTMNVQGKLTDAGGSPVADASYSVDFTIYDSASAGNALWTETNSVATVDGLFSVIIGATTPLANSVFNNQNLWLGLKVDTDQEMAPRQKLASVPFALSPPSPIAFGMINTDGTVRSGWPAGISASWKGASYYEITIPGVSYVLWNYVTVVTPNESTPLTAATASVSSQLLVYLYDSSGTKVQGMFQFIIYKP